MKSLLILLLVAVCALSHNHHCMKYGSDVDHVKLNEHQECASDSVCPTWFTCEQKNYCKCGESHENAIACDNEHQVSAVLDCYCVTYDNVTESTYLGLCFFSCSSKDWDYPTDCVHRKLPRTPAMLINNSACTHLHRTGKLCGECEDGHSPLVVSYNFDCVPCPDGHTNWWKFVLVAFLPLTLFFLLVVIFNINVTSSRLYGIVWFSQAVSIPPFARLIVVSFTGPKLVLAKVTVMFYSYWNLDILRFAMPPICLNVTTIQALALDYLTALYPFLLILVSYFMIVLYDRRCVCIVTLWRPFHKVLSLFKQTWNVRTSIIDSFSTFFLLSYTKFISVSSDLLLPTKVYKLGTSGYTLGVYYSPSVDYFGHEHLPYAILALTLLTVFVFIPTIALILYPFRLFQRFLSLFPLNWHFLHVFVDSYQGCYKDGTEPGTFDCRWFAMVMLLLRLLLFVIYLCTLLVMFFVYVVIVLVILLIFYVNIEPFKKVASHQPFTDKTCLFLLSLCYLVLIGEDVAYVQSNQHELLLISIAFAFAIIPNVYIIGVVCCWAVSATRWVKLRTLKQIISPQTSH